MQTRDWLISIATFVVLAGCLATCCAEDAPREDAPKKVPQAHPRNSLEAKLAVRVDLKPDRVPLRAYLEALAKEHGFEVAFDKRPIEAQSISLDRPISGDLRAYSLKAGLERLLRKYGLEPRIEGDLLMIGAMAPQPVAAARVVQARAAMPEMAVNVRARRVRVLMNRGLNFTVHNPLFRPVDAVPDEEEEEQLVNEGNELARRRMAREYFYQIIEWEGPAGRVQNRLKDLLAGQIHGLDNELDLSAVQQHKLRLAGQGDIERLLTLAEDTRDRFTTAALAGGQLIEIPFHEYESLQTAVRSSTFDGIVGAGSKFEKVRERILTDEQKAARSAIQELRSAGAIVRTRTADGPGIREVFLAPRRVDKAAMAHLAAFKKIEQLSLSSATIEDQDLSLLKDLGNLKSLDLSLTEIGDDGLAHLEGLILLEELDLHRTGVSDRGLSALRRMKSLRTLNLSETKCSDDGLANLRGFGLLESLNLSGLAITNEGLERMGIREMTSLRELRLSNAVIEKGGLECLSDLRQLQRLELNGVVLRDVGLQPLSGLTNLRVLFLDRSDIRDDDLAALSKLSNLERLDLQRTHVTDAGLNHLKDLKQLRSLDLWQTEVTKEGATGLEAAIPQLRIIQ